MKKILVLGGTGFLGFYTVEELLKKGYEVKSVALPPMPVMDLFSSDQVENILTDINDLTDEEVLHLLEDVDGIMYAIGADERIVPDAPAYSFFYEANVLPTQRLARLAVKAGVESFVIFGSYFAEFAERITDVPLRDEPYPSTRLLQEQVAFAEGEGKMRVTSLRLPYIFGSMPGRTPLWKMFTDRVKDQTVFPVLKGGTAAVTATQVAQAAVGALEKGEHRKTYALGGFNLTHKEFIDRIVKALGQEETTEVPIVPIEAVIESYRAMDEQIKASGKEQGMHMEMIAEMNNRELFIDPTEVMAELGYDVEDVSAAIDETLEVIMKEYK